jgi:hypothetical protein
MRTFPLHSDFVLWACEPAGIRAKIFVQLEC